MQTQPIGISATISSFQTQGKGKQEMPEAVLEFLLYCVKRLNLLRKDN